MPPTDKARKKAAKVLALRMRLVYIVLRLFVWGSLFLGTNVLKKCAYIPLTSVEKPAVIVNSQREVIH